MRIKRKLLVIAIFCSGTALAMALSGQDDQTDSGKVGTLENTRATVVQDDDSLHEARLDSHFDLSSIKRSNVRKVRNSAMFQSKSWYTPPPPPPVSLLPPPPPSAPQLPFAYIGRMMDGKNVTLFLARNDSQYTAKENDVLDNTYRIDKITDSDATLTYLPMNIQQTLVFNTAGSSNPSITSVPIQPLQSALGMQLSPVQQRPPVQQGLSVSQLSR